jgi:hypothetical protein
MKNLFTDVADIGFGVITISLPLVCIIILASSNLDERENFIRVIMDSMERTQSIPHIEKLPDPEPFRYQI